MEGVSAVSWILITLFRIALLAIFLPILKNFKWYVAQLSLSFSILKSFLTALSSISHYPSMKRNLGIREASLVPLTPFKVNSIKGQCCEQIVFNSWRKLSPCWNLWLSLRSCASYDYIDARYWTVHKFTRLNRSLMIVQPYDLVGSLGYLGHILFTNVNNPQINIIILYIICYLFK